MTIRNFDPKQHHAIAIHAKPGRGGNNVILTVAESYATGPIAGKSSAYRLFPDDAVELAREIANAVQSIGNPEADYADDE
jgi:hypothetical protein